jgi:hypothetical protein
VDGADLPTILTYASRERARSLVRSAFPKRKWRVIAARDAAEFSSIFHRVLVDAALVDIGSPLALAGMASTTAGNGGQSAATNGGGNDDTWKVAALALEFPSAPFFAITPLRATDAPAVARCTAMEFCDVIADGMDEPVARDLVAADLLSEILRRPRRPAADAPAERADAAPDLAGDHILRWPAGPHQRAGEGGGRKPRASEPELLGPRLAQPEESD